MYTEYTHWWYIPEEAVIFFYLHDIMDSHSPYAHYDP